MVKLALSPHEQQLADKLSALKADAGSHSPSVLTLRDALPELPVNVDACFLSNPYATDLFVEYLKRELVNTQMLRDVLEFYPSQNEVIASFLAPQLQVDAASVFVGNGAIEIIQSAIHNFCRGKIMVNLPTFSSYYEFAQRRFEVVFHHLSAESGFRLDVERYLEQVHAEQPDMVVLINPNNPDGTHIVYADIVRILENLPPSTTAVIDESFIHFAYEGEDLAIQSAVKEVERFPNLIVVKSMSKDFGVAGIRAGYAVMSPDRVHQLLDDGYLWNSNGLAEYFFRLYCRDQFLAEYDIVRRRYIGETQQFYEAMTAIKPLQVFPSMANFVLCRLPDGVDADEFGQVMLVRHGVYVRSCSDKIGLNGPYLRIASRGTQENHLILTALSDMFE